MGEGEERGGERRRRRRRECFHVRVRVCVYL